MQFMAHVAFIGFAVTSSCMHEPMMKKGGQINHTSLHVR
jgi:hypothetical protein